ncbi:MAG: hypothetical protein A2W71_02885 [Candidatus Nealsonbacteria bacterium RIFCSPLOWO2_02_39_8]|uniref:SHS2 domain-containing protein n=1 Tax=Candidatus Nealsonbacteria bacterium RIFCSPLOWO2_02_39_8 TaxID=1801674 RepID=A0A1G2EGF5_9BACT|nr:MAG: hypothetical protein A2W71_02885 [Candidatus Nealsonbacteria bacterium RIFCSPLOWO2_02_39_8]
MFDNFKKLIGIRQKIILGIDVGSASIKAVEISRKNQNFILENYGELDCSLVKKPSIGEADKNIISFTNKQLAEIIKAILRESEMRSKEVVFSIPDFSSFFTTIKLPIMSQEEIPEVIKYEVKPYIPLPVSEITLDWLITEGEISKTSLKILVVAIPNEIIDQYKEIAFLAGLDLKILEPEVFSLSRAVVIGEDRGKTVGLVDIGARSATINVLEKGMLKMSHSFNVAGNEIADAIAKSLNIEYNEARGLKEKQGLTIGTGKNAEAEKAMIPLVNFILEEVKNTFRDFYEDEGKKPQKIILAGGTVLMPGLKDYFSSEFEQEIAIANPFLGLSYPTALGSALKQTAPSYGVAIGLAIKGLE